MILYNQSASVTDLETDNHYLPAIQIQYSQGQSLLSFPGGQSWRDGDVAGRRQGLGSR